MAITVTGLDRFDIPYTARIGLTAQQFDEIDAAGFGESVRTTPIIAAALRRDQGKPVPLTPTGPDVELDDYDTASVLAWLRTHTTVLSMADESGAEIGRDLRVGEARPGIVY